MERTLTRSRSDFDESDVKIRPKKHSRPRTKLRPAYNDAVPARVVTVDRGRWGCIREEESSDLIYCVRSRSLGRKSIVVGDLVDIVGDLSGGPDKLARIVRIHPRTSTLRRTADDTDPYERVVVANAEQLLIVTAAADPTPRTGFVERALLAAYVAGLTPILCVTKSDLADPSEFIAQFEALDLPVVYGGIDDDLAPLEDRLENKVTALIGHSGVGKSSLVNRLIPDAHRPTGVVSGIGKGRHTSTQSFALELPSGGWIIDTPGIRSLGLAHVSPESVLGAFPDLEALSEECPGGCTHLGPPADLHCAFDRVMEEDPSSPTAHRAEAVRSLLTVLRSNRAWSLGIEIE